MHSSSVVSRLEGFQWAYVYDFPVKDSDVEFLKIRIEKLNKLVEMETHVLDLLSQEDTLDPDIVKRCGFDSIGQMCRYYDELREKYDEHQMDLKIMHGLIEHREGLRLYESGLVGKIEWARRRMLKKLKKILI